MPFMGINNLRSADESVPMERWQLLELQKCARDPLYFIKNYVKITTRNEGVKLFDMWDFQEELIETMHNNRFTIVKYPRQSGKSTTTRGYFIWYSLFHRKKTLAILANKLSLAQEQLQQLRDSYMELPYWMQPGVSAWNKRGITLSNGTRVMCASTSPDGIRGMAIDCLFLDEFAFVPPHIADEFVASVFPVVSSGNSTKIIITSTPAGMNLFYQMWSKAELGPDHKDWNQFIPVQVPWNAIPGRNEEWAEKERKKIGDIRFNQEYKCDFIGSVSTLIDHNFLKKLTKKKKEPLQIPRLPEILKIWELPRPQRELEAKNWEYVASLDSGYGVHEDFTVLKIYLAKSNINVHLVAQVAANDIEIEDYCARVLGVLKKYHNPSLIIEQNGPGTAATSFFYNRAEYENLLHFDPKGMKMGLWSTELLKEKAAIILKAYVQRGMIKDYDPVTIDEMVSFGRVTTKKWGGLGGNHDDHITSMLWVPYYLQSPLFFGNVVDIDIKQLAQDEIILSGDAENEAETMVFEEMKNAEFHKEELGKAAEYEVNTSQEIYDDEGTDSGIKIIGEDDDDDDGVPLIFNG